MKYDCSFFLSLILFVFLLCSCKSKEVATQRLQQLQVRSDISVFNEQAKVDTTKTKIIEQTEQFTRVIRRETITEYDTDKQTPSKVTEKEEIFEQGNNSKTDKIEDRGLSEVKKDSLNHIADASKMVETEEEVKEESVMSGMFVNLGKWLGIGLCVIFGIALIWKALKNKLPL